MDVTQIGGKNPRRFYLRRDIDSTGVSGTGRVADGVQWSDGTVTVRWRARPSATCVWSNMGELEEVHGHNGATQVVWLDPEP
jgi:hypothetical protein